MVVASRSRHVAIGVTAGSMAGFAGGLAMIPFFILNAFMMGMPATAVLASIGLAFGADTNSAVALGTIMHLAASVLIGILFGIVTGAVDWLRITTYRKGVGLGLITGMIAFAALFIPMIMPSMISPAGLTMQQGMSVMIGIAEHLAYGAVLGAVTAKFVLGGKRRAEGIFECSTCHGRFTRAQDLDEHIRISHQSAAA